MKRIMILTMILSGTICVAENIDPYDTNAQYGWGENIGWISLSCENTSTCATVSYGVANDGSGNLSGFAWAENVGWIKFDSTQRYNARACVVTLDDLLNFASYWLQRSMIVPLPAELNGDRTVDYGDFNIFAQYWQDFCPDGWRLK